MGDIYLTKNLKKRYMYDFENHVLEYKKANVWKLDAGLEHLLASINKNPHIQTLYSRKDAFEKAEYLHESYLEFCYSASVEPGLFREIIPSFNFNFIREFRSVFYYQFDYPRDNLNYIAGVEPTGMGCVDDDTYFKVNTIRFTLESPIRRIHEQFWHAVEEKLSVIKPTNRTVNSQDASQKRALHTLYPTNKQPVS
ncbi:MAG: hypothetical protein ACM3NR_04350 [Methanosarcina sp.]